MNNARQPFVWVMLMLWAPFHVFGQANQVRQPLSLRAIERDLHYAEALLRSYKNDSAGILTYGIIEELKAQDLLDTPLGLRAQLVEAISLEQEQDGDEAILRLLHVAERCQAKSLWDLSAKADLNLALLYEKSGLKERSMESLQHTKGLIDQHGLDSIYPYYAIRMSSWQRIYGAKDSALYYTREALHTAPQFQLDLEEAIGHMLMNMLLPQEAIAQRLDHSFAAVKLYQKLEDYTGCSFMFGAVASIFFQENDLPKALQYNDSTLLMAHTAIAKGHDKLFSIAGNYRFRGEIFRAMGQWDSAWVNLHKGYKLALDFKDQDIQDKIIEIDARYNNTLKQEQIEEQALELTLKDAQLRYSALVAVLVLLLAAGLAIGLYKQRQGKRQLAAQNTLILEQSEQLKTLDAAKSRFFANVSHELRTPLTLILGPVRTLLKENQLTEKQTKLLQATQRSGMELQELVDEILDLRKLEMGKMELSPQSTALALFFRNCMAQFDSMAQGKQIEYSMDIDISDDTIVELDQPKCRQIVNNLLSNAFKFTPAGGRITAAASYRDGMLHMEVSDTGAGIHPDDLPHIFDRFFQTKRPDKPAEGGTGIGLALCREYALLFGGDIRVESALHQGTVFRVFFPVAFSEEPLPSLPITPASWQAHFMPYAPYPMPYADRPTILLVEDNLELQNYIRLILSSKYHVVTAGNGQEALDYILPTADCPPPSRFHFVHRDVASLQLPTTDCKLILSDLMMPVMDGYQLLERLKSDDATRHIPVIMLTARAEAKDKLKALRIGVDDYLTKPFDEEELLARIGNLLKNRAAREHFLLEEPPATAFSPLALADAEWLADFEAYVRAHLADELLSISFLAQELAMSESTLLRQVNRLTGLSPKQYLLEARLHAAREMLENKTHSSVAQVAAQVGYANARTFSRSFRQRFGKLPSEV